jgi:penicillin V acylase-like amidase (Ntn superfamily)
MVFNATFNTTSVTSWRSVLLVEETGITGQSYSSVSIQWDRCDQFNYKFWDLLVKRHHLYRGT